MLISLNEHYKPIRTYGEPFFGLSRLPETIESYPLNLNADFQRAHVWTRDNQIDFMSFLLSGGQVPPCYANIGPHGTWRVAEIVDGKQRITACIAWRNGEIPALLGNTGVYWDDIDQVSKTYCSTQIGIRIAMLQCSRREALFTYIKLNSGGVLHTNKEIEKVQRLLEEEEAKEQGTNA